MNPQTPVHTYETRYARLQELVQILETGDLPLDRTITLYEEGVRLASECQTILDAAELRVQQLHSGNLGIEHDH